MTVYPIINVNNHFLTRIGPYLVWTTMRSGNAGQFDTSFYPVSEYGHLRCTWRSFGNADLIQALFFGKELDTNVAVPFEELILPEVPLKHPCKTFRGIKTALQWLVSL